MKTTTLFVVCLAVLAFTGCTKKLETEIASLKTELASIRATNEAAEKQLAELKPELAATRTQRDQLAEQKNAANVQLANLSAENQALRVRVAGLEDALKKSLPPPSYELSGEMFIATRGGTAFKLGAVQVFLVSRKEADAWVDARKKLREQLLKELGPKTERAKKESAAAEEVYERAKKKSDEAFHTHLDRITDKRLEADYNAASVESERTSKLYFEKLGALAKSEAEVKYLLSGEFFFESLPRYVAVTRTNSDGRFKFTVERNGDWVAVAQAQRAVGDSAENYYWAVPIATPRGESCELLLSNGNLSSVAGASLFYSLDR